MCNRGSDSLKNTFLHAFMPIIPCYIAICHPTEIRSIILNLHDDILYGITGGSTYSSSHATFFRETIEL